jgi:predicted enzyme related to lactoylglutathione lyase
MTKLAAVLPVADVRRALRHYSALGFETSAYDDGEVDEPYYGFARRGEADLHFSRVDRLDAATNTSAVYLYVDDAEALYTEWRTAGVGGRLHRPEATDYGLREGAHVDLDGNLLRFGSPIAD